jgi:hypothetical protein
VGTVSNRNLNISDWHQPPRVNAVAESRASNRWSSALGLIGTLLLHTLVLQTVLLGSRAHKVRPPEVQGPGATLIKSDSDPKDPLVLVQMPSADVHAKALVEDLASAGSGLKTTQLVTMISPDPLPHIDIPQDAIGDNNDAVASIDSGDPAARAALFGLYTGQIDARIERAWRRPRSPVNPDADTAPEPNRRSANNEAGQETFRCQVRIIQDHQGDVQEVLLLDCNGSVEWQQSLLRAIFSSSPLPAPPSATVFTHSLILTFEGHTYASTSVADDYAPVGNHTDIGSVR